MSSIAQGVAINTGRVEGRRVLRFDRVDDALNDVQVLADADRRGAIRQLGNWTFGQSLGHLATWVDYSYEGVPMKPPPLPVRWMVRMMKRRILYKSMPAGRNIPGVAQGTLAKDVVPADVGEEHFRRSFTRLLDQAPTQPHILFGAMSHEEWIALHLRHAELHLSFFRVD